MKQTFTKTELFAQSMSRREFMKFLALGLLAMLGLNNLMSFLNSRAHQQSQVQATQQVSGHGFGSSRFGV